MPLEIHQFPCRSDNYGFLAHDTETALTACIDTPDAHAINAALAEKGWRLSHILNTHHHGDHTGGNLQLKERWGCVVVGAANDAARIPGIDVQVADGDEYGVGTLVATVSEVPGHTTGHIAYHLAGQGVAFVGDTLFALGCGRLFEGTSAMMWNSLQRIMALPDETAVYCAHEYTQTNARFALTVEPGNERLVARSKEIDGLREQGLPTVPTTIGLERATNPFVRPMSDDLQATIGMIGDDPVAVFAEVRKRKDAF